MEFSPFSNFTDVVQTLMIWHLEEVVCFSNLKFVRVAKLRAQTYCTSGVNARPLHGDGDAVEEDDNQHNVVKHLVGDDLIAHVPKPDRKQREEEVS